jgi:hypothetical protein
MQIASQALGGTEKWATWPGTTFNKDSEQFAALMATPSGRGVAWLLLSHRKQLGWKSVSKINLWSEADHDSKSNYYSFQLEDGVSQTRSARSTRAGASSSFQAVQRHAERDAKNNDTSIVYDSDSVSARYGELFASDHDYSYDQAQKIGGYLVNLTISDAEESCVQQSQWKFSDLKSNGWDSTTSKLDDKATLVTLKTIFSDVKLSIDDENPEHTIWEHARSSVVNGKTNPATHAKYDALYSKHAITLLGASNPASALQKDGKELLPSLKALSDVLWLQWADWSNAKKNDIKDLRFIVVYQSTNAAVEKGKKFLEMLNCGSGPQSKWTNYDDLANWGWVKTVDQPLDIPDENEVNAMNYLKLSPLLALTQIHFVHRTETEHHGKNYPGTEAYYDDHYSSEIITAMANYGPLSQAEKGDPLPELGQLSDVWFLVYSELMRLQNKPLDKLKGILRHQILNPDTVSLLRRATGMDEYDNHHSFPRWPGKDFATDSDEVAALLASPNGRGIAWFLLNHRQLGRKTVDRVRAWYEPEEYAWMMLFVFKDVTDESGDQSESADTDLPKADVVQQSARSTVALRAIGLSPEKYKDMLGKGKWLVSLLQSTEVCFPQSEFTKYEDLAEWGWTMEFDAKAGPRKSQVAKDVFNVVKASWDANANRMVLDAHDVTKEKDGKTYHRTEARYSNYYNPSLIIAKSNFGPAFWGPRQNPKVTGGADDPFPVLPRLSDILFLEFQRVMTENKQPMKELKGFWRESVENQDTKELATQISSDNGMLHGIPKWPGVDYGPDSDEFAALLGSPNGVGVAYILLQHREQLGQKTIKSVRVWYVMALHILFMVDDVENEPGTSQRQRRSKVDSSAISPYLKLETWTNSLHRRALDDSTYSKLVEKGKALVTALQSTDVCLAQSEWTADESLSTWGWYRSRKPNVGPVSQFTATKQVYEFVGASMDNNMNHRAMDMHDTKKEIDGVTYYKTGAEFDNRYNPAMIIAEGIYGAEYQGKDKNPPVTGNPNPFPKLKFWSDVTFLEFQKFMKDSNQAMDSLKAVWQRMIINPDTRELAARLTRVNEWTDVPDWPGKDFKPGTDEFASLIGSDNGKSIVYLLLQHRTQLGARTITNARVWKDHSLHVIYSIDDSCAGDDADAPKPTSLFRRLDGPDSQKVNDARDAGRFLIMAQDSSADILESCLGIPQSEFTEPKQLGESG